MARSPPPPGSPPPPSNKGRDDEEEAAAQISAGVAAAHDMSVPDMSFFVFAGFDITSRQLRRRTRARRRQSLPNQKHHSVKEEIGYLWGKLRQDLSFKSCSSDPITGPSIVHHRLTWKGKPLDPPQHGTLLPEISSLRLRPPPVPPTICITMPYTNCIMYILRMERRLMERRTMTDGNGTTWGNWTEGEKKLKQIDLLLASPRGGDHLGGFKDDTNDCAVDHPHSYDLDPEKIVGLSEAPNVWHPPGEPPDFDPNKHVWRFKDAPGLPTDYEHNPANWPLFVFRPKFDGRAHS